MNTQTKIGFAARRYSLNHALGDLWHDLLFIMKNFASIHRKSLIYIAFSLGLAILLLLFSNHSEGFGQAYATHVFPLFPNTLGRLFSPVPVSVFEIGLYSLAAFITAGFLYAVLLLTRKRGRQRLRKLLPPCCLALFCFASTIFLMLTLACTISYNRNGFAADAGLAAMPSSQQTLTQLCELLISDLNSLTKQIDVDASGAFTLKNTPVGDEAKKAMGKLGKTYPSLAGYYPNPKPVLLSQKMSDINLTGIFSPYTIEANYNRDVPDYTIPYTICHELAHLKGYIREDEAGFISYLACSSSSSPTFRYSGALNALSYSLNALRSNSTQAEYQHVLAEVPPQALQDLRINNAYWQGHSGKVSRIATGANDKYLKANAQEGGIKSYGRMVDLLIAYYKLDAKEI